MFGHYVELLVFDCRYRYYATSRPARGGTGPTVNVNGSNYILGSDQGTTTVVTVEDANLDYWLGNGKNMTMANVAGARISTIGSYPTYLANVYELAVLRIEADNIDNFDKYKSNSSYNNCLISSQNAANGHYYFSFGYYGAMFACSDVSVSDRLAIGTWTGSGVIPVYELTYN